MWMRIAFASGLMGLLFVLSLSSHADEPKAKFPADIIPSTFRAYLVKDGRYPPVKGTDGKEQLDPRDRTGKIHCLVCENGLAPVVAIFVRADPNTLPGDKGVAELIKRVNDLIPKHRSDKLASFVMFLRLEGGTKIVTVKTINEDKTETEKKVEQDLEFPDEDLEKREKAVESIKAFGSALNAPNVPLGLAADKPSKAVTAWGIPDKEDAEVMVVVYDHMRRVGEPFKFKTAKPEDVTDEKIGEILKRVEDAIAGPKK